MLVNGSIVDKVTGNIIKNCEILQISNNIPLGPPLLVADGNFTGLNVVLDQNTFFVFSSPGYSTVYVNTIDILASGADNYNVFLEPIKKEAGAVIVGAGLLALLLLASKKKAATTLGKLETKDVYPYLLIGGVLVATGAIKKLLQSVGIMDSTATQNLNALTADPNSFWSPNYYKQFSQFNYSLDKATATKMCIDIDSAFGYFSDNVSAVDAVFKQLKTKAEVSYLADVFNQISGEDLLTYLRGTSWPTDRLSDAEVNTINSYLQQLPTN